VTLVKHVHELNTAVMSLGTNWDMCGVARLMCKSLGELQLGNEVHVTIKHTLLRLYNYYPSPFTIWNEFKQRFFI